MSLFGRISHLLSKTPLALLPVRVRRGPARGARWTLLPFSSNWRHGGEEDLEAGLALLDPLKGAVCWDFGAHFGIHTVGMAMKVGPAGQVVAFEPDPVAFARLKRHVEMNHLGNVVLQRAAASATSGAMKMIVTQGLGSTFSHLRYQDEPEPRQDETLRIEAVSPDEIAAAGRIKVPDLIKIDVQGHGDSALRGSAESIQKKRPIIVFSGHSRWEVEGAREVLEPLGYRVQSLRGESMDWRLLESQCGILCTSNR